MDGANQSFILGKANWLQTNLIVYNVQKGMNNPFNQGNGTVDAELPVKDFDLRKIGAILAEDAPGGQEFDLRGLTDDRSPSRLAHPLKAYFLPWGKNQTFCGKLGLGADFFFTPTLNGCTFVFKGDGPNPSVAHSNFVNADTEEVDQARMNATLAALFGGVVTAAVVKTDYKRIPPIATEDYRATVIGIRDGNNWKFYYQNYKADLNAAGTVVVNTALKNRLCVEFGRPQ